ncbi:hypothetical protein GCM10027589_35710 [Actinocorallia lasiicapitis]
MVEYGPAASRARRERVTVQWVVQSLTRLYGAGLLDLGEGTGFRSGRAFVQTRQFWLHRQSEHDAAARRASHDGVVFGLVVRALLRAYGEGEIDLVVVARDRRGAADARRVRPR